MNADLTEDELADAERWSSSVLPVNVARMAREIRRHRNRVVGRVASACAYNDSGVCTSCSTMHARAPSPVVATVGQDVAEQIASWLEAHLCGQDRHGVVTALGRCLVRDIRAGVWRKDAP